MIQGKKISSSSRTCSHIIVENRWRSSATMNHRSTIPRPRPLVRCAFQISRSGRSESFFQLRRFGDMAEDIGRFIDLFLCLQWQPWTIAFPRYASRRAAPCRVALRRYVVIESRICLATSFQHENKCDCASARTWGRDRKEKEKRRTALVKARPRCINRDPTRHVHVPEIPIACR